MKKIYIIVFLIIALFSLIIFIQGRLSVFVRGSAIKELNKIINTKADIEDVNIDILRGLVSFSELRVQNPSGFTERNFLEIKRGYINVDLIGLLFKKVEIKKMFLDRPNVSIEINRELISNTRLIFKKQSAGTKGQRHNNSPQTTKYQFKINEVDINNGAFKFVNYKVNPEGAAAFFDEINIVIENLTASQNLEEFPTSVKCLARLPAKDLIGHIEFTAKGAFLSNLIGFDLDLKANSISLPYFMPFYIYRAPVFAKRGYFDLNSTAKCRRNEIYATQQVNVRDLELVVNPANLSDNLAFGLPVMTVVNFFINSQGSLNFDFEITGTLSDPRFHIGEALQKALVKTIGNAILNNLSKLPDRILEKVKETGNIEDAGKEALKDVLQQILGPKKEQGQENDAE